MVRPIKSRRDAPTKSPVQISGKLDKKNDAPLVIDAHLRTIFNVSTKECGTALRCRTQNQRLLKSGGNSAELSCESRAKSCSKPNENGPNYSGNQAVFQRRYTTAIGLQLHPREQICEHF
jgi:hypothetical protein